MKTFLTLAVLATVAAAAPAPASAECNLSTAVAQCNALIPQDAFMSTTLRGWCYIGGLACALD